MKFFFAMSVLAQLLALTILTHAVCLPSPSEQYNVGASQHTIPHITTNDPLNPKGTNTFILATIYYPTSSNTTFPITYFDPTSAQIWGEALGYPNGTLQTLQVTLQHNASPLEKSSDLPTLIFSPGGGVNSYMYYTFLAHLASKGYTIILLDHPGEAPYLPFFNGSGIEGLSIYTTFNTSTSQRIYELRVDDITTTLSWFPDFATRNNLPFNTTTYITMGHSVGGAAAAGSLALHNEIIAGVNLDGQFWEPIPTVDEPFLIMTSINHTSGFDPTLTTFASQAASWWEWLSVYNSGHLDYSDIGVWPDITNLTGRTGTPQIGSISGLRMMQIVRKYVGAFLNMVTKGEGDHVLKQPSLNWREVIYVADSWSEKCS